MKRLTFLAVAILLTVSSHLFAAGPEPVALWPKGAPQAQGQDESDQPTIRVYLPEKDRATGTGIVICPGGGYGILAMDHEGHQVAKWLNEKGIAGFVLRYRHSPKYRHPVPLEDAQRALRLVRSRASEYGLSARRIGIMGFSAGGHLASTAATHFDAGKADAADPIDRLSCRPDFAVLCYPVINLVENFGHRGSARNLLGEKPDPQVLESLCNEKQVTKETPPTFLFHTGEDPGVPVENALAFYQACKKHGVPAELHVYQDGPHGVGLAVASPVVGGWKDRLYDWLQSTGFLTDTKRVAVSGVVTLNGEPLRWGMIAFVPVDPKQPRAFALIGRDGKFSIPAARGAVVGEHSVEVFNLGSVEPRPTIEDAVRLDRGQLRFIITDGMNDVRLDLGQAAK